MKCIFCKYFKVITYNLNRLRKTNDTHSERIKTKKP